MLVVMHLHERVLFFLFFFFFSFCVCMCACVHAESAFGLRFIEPRCGLNSNSSTPHGCRYGLSQLATRVRGPDFSIKPTYSVIQYYRYVAMKLVSGPRGICS